MLKEYTAQEMLTLWRRSFGLAPSPRAGGFSDATELDEVLAAQIEVWYDRLLREAPPELLPTADLAGLTAARATGENSAEIPFPERGVRPLRLRMEGWTRDVTLFADPASLTASMQSLRHARACPEDPVAILFPRLIEAHGLAPAPSLADTLADASARIPAQRPAPAIERLEMVVRPPEGLYVLDTALLDFINF